MGGYFNRLTTRFFLVEPCVRTFRGEAGVECAHGVTVRVGVAEEDFEGAFFGSHFLNREAREEREGLFFEFEQANVFQIHGAACRTF